MGASTLFLTALPPQGKALLDTTNTQARVDCIDQYALPSLSLNRYHGILISMMADQRLLLREKERLESYLQQGGTLVINGHIAYPFLDLLQPFIPIKDPSLEDFKVERQSPHPVFESITAEGMNERRHVAGFWGRGANPPPVGASCIHTLEQGKCPIDWEYQPPTGGRILMHSGNDMWITLENEADNERLFTQLLDWIEEPS